MEIPKSPLFAMFAISGQKNVKVLYLKFLLSGYP